MSFRIVSGAIIIFTSVLARIFIRRKLPLYKWIAVLITTIGIVVVGLADILPNPLDKNENSNTPDALYNSSYALSGFRYKSSMFSLGKFETVMAVAHMTQMKIMFNHFVSIAILSHKYEFVDSFVGFPRPSYTISNLGNDTDNCPEIPDKEDSEGNWVGDVMTIAAVVRIFKRLR